MKKSLLLILGILTLIWTSYLGYYDYKDHVAKQNGKTIFVDIIEVQNCDIYSKKYLIGFTYKNTMHYISTGKVKCREYASQKTMEIIYYEKGDRFFAPDANPLRDCLIVMAIWLLGLILTIKGLLMMRRPG